MATHYTRVSAVKPFRFSEPIECDNLDLGTYIEIYTSWAYSRADLSRVLESYDFLLQYASLRSKNQKNKAGYWSQWIHLESAYFQGR
jgi:hypothetical protein